MSPRYVFIPSASVESDRDLRDQAQRRLEVSPYLELRHIDCRVDASVLTLSGRVSTYFLKQMAQSAVSDLAVTEIVNNIEVDSSVTGLQRISAAQFGAARSGETRNSTFVRSSTARHWPRRFG